MKKHKIVRKQPNSKMCFVCGLDNSFGLKSRFYELESGELLAMFRPEEQHQGYPGRLHGGLAATILDETIGRSIMISTSDTIWGVTVEFSMRLKKPVPMDGEIRVLARTISENRRFFEGSGEILLPGGGIAVQATGRYMKVDIEKIADFDLEEQQWGVVAMEDDPTSVEL
ncbi:MAG TPA: PaaI family thioesterase [Desulfobulbaceae bacterium]|nr:PaaI family thioesterase [Desulfobulbaceae bacterium]